MKLLYKFTFNVLILSSFILLGMEKDNCPNVDTTSYFSSISPEILLKIIFQSNLSNPSEISKTLQSLRLVNLLFKRTIDNPLNMKTIVTTISSQINKSPAHVADQLKVPSSQHMRDTFFYNICLSGRLDSEGNEVVWQDKNCKNNFDFEYYKDNKNRIIIPLLQSFLTHESPISQLFLTRFKKSGIIDPTFGNQGIQRFYFDALINKPLITCDSKMENFLIAFPLTKYEGKPPSQIKLLKLNSEGNIPKEWAFGKPSTITLNGITNLLQRLQLYVPQRLIMFEDLTDFRFFPTNILMINQNIILQLALKIFPSISEQPHQQESVNYTIYLPFTDKGKVDEPQITSSNVAIELRINPFMK